MTTPINPPASLDSVQEVINGITDRLNALGEVDWGQLVGDAETPADIAEIVWSLQTVAGMLQYVAAAAYEPVKEMFTGMIAASLAAVDNAQEGVQ